MLTYYILHGTQYLCMYEDYGITNYKETLKFELTCFTNIFTKIDLHELEQQYTYEYMTTREILMQVINLLTVLIYHTWFYV